jgi:hypothetical protein
MVRLSSTALTLAAALLLAGCGDDTESNTPTGPTPVAVTESFSGTLNPNGGITHPFAVQQTGSVSATLSVVTPEGTTIGLSLGTWNGQSCQIILANDNAVQGISVVGTATSTGSFCARVYDVGKLSSLTDYELSVSHY